MSNRARKRPSWKKERRCIRSKEDQIKYEIRSYLLKMQKEDQIIIDKTTVIWENRR